MQRFDSDRNVTDDTGEEARQVLYLDQRMTVFYIMLCLATALLICGLSLILYGSARNDPMVHSRPLMTLWLLFILSLVLYLLYTGLYSRNTRVELYKDHFLYRNALCRRKRYEYTDCLYRREKRYGRYGQAFTATLYMKDGSRIKVDERILRSGFGAAIGYRRLREKRRSQRVKDHP